MNINFFKLNKYRTSGSEKWPHWCDFECEQSCTGCVCELMVVLLWQVMKPLAGRGVGWGVEFAEENGSPGLEVS